MKVVGVSNSEFHYLLKSPGLVHHSHLLSFDRRDITKMQGKNQLLIGPGVRKSTMHNITVTTSPSIVVFTFAPVASKICMKEEDLCMCRNFPEGRSHYLCRWGKKQKWTKFHNQSSWWQNPKSPNGHFLAEICNSLSSYHDINCAKIALHRGGKRRSWDTLPT